MRLSTTSSIRFWGKSMAWASILFAAAMVVINWDEMRGKTDKTVITVISNADTLRQFAKPVTSSVSAAGSKTIEVVSETPGKNS